MGTIFLSYCSTMSFHDETFQVLSLVSDNVEPLIVTKGLFCFIGFSTWGRYNCDFIQSFLSYKQVR